MHRFDLLDEFATVCAPHVAQRRDPRRRPDATPTAPRRRWIAPVAIALAGLALIWL